MVRDFLPFLRVIQFLRDASTRANSSELSVTECRNARKPGRTNLLATRGTGPRRLTTNCLALMWSITRGMLSHNIETIASVPKRRQFTYRNRGRKGLVLEVLEAREVLAASLSSGFQETLLVSGLISPTAETFAPDGRLFVAEKGGTIKVIVNGVLQSEPVLTLAVDTFIERGLK